MHSGFKRFAPLFAAMFAVVLAACGMSDGQEKGGKGPGGHGGMPPPQVTVVAVQPQARPATFEYVGQTLGSREIEVRGRVTGILLKRHFVEGMPVKAGQSLYTIDPAPFEAALARVEADVGAADARLDQARRSAARLKPLYQEKAVSQKEYDDAVSGEAIANADAKAARARLVEAKLNMTYTRVESPASGVAGRSQRSEGTLVSGPDVLLTTVTQVDPIWVNFGIPDNEQLRIQRESESGRLKLPKDNRFEVVLRLADGSQYERIGRVTFNDVRISAATGTREARAEIPNPDGALRPGQFVRVILRGAVRPETVSVPQRSVMEGPQGKFVYVVDEKSTAQARPVEVGEWSEESWLITSGLKAGERVIVDGVMKLGPGAPVQVAEKGPEKAADKGGPEKGSGKQPPQKAPAKK